MKYLERTLPVQKGSELYDRINNIQKLYRRMVTWGVVNAVTTTVGTPIRALTMEAIDGVKDWKQPVYKGSTERHEAILQTFRQGGWVANIQMPEFENGQWVDYLRVDFIRHQEDHAVMTFHGDELYLKKGRYRYTTRLGKNVKQNMQKLLPVFKYAFLEPENSPFINETQANG